jgi:hypothetical protein
MYSKTLGAFGRFLVGLESLGNVRNANEFLGMLRKV